MLIVQVEDTQTGHREEFTFDRTPVRVGRSPLNDLPLPRGFVSHYHGILHFEEQRVQFVDLGSTNGSCVNGAALAANSPCPLASDARLEIGPLVLRAEVQTGQSARTSSYAFRAVSGSHEVTADRSNHRMRRFAISDAEAGSAPADETPKPSAADSPPQAPASSRELRSSYVSYRSAWLKLLTTLKQQVSHLPPSERAAYLEALVADMDALPQEADFRKLLGSDRGLPSGSAAAAAAPNRVRRTGPDASSPLGALVEGLDAGSPERRRQAEERVVALLHRFAETFLELRRSQTRFREELSLTLPPRDREIEARDTAEDLLSYLLSEHHARSRLEGLSRAFADLMLHQVAVLNAVRVGARSLLDRLDPDVLEALPGGAWLGRVVGQGSAWEAFKREYHDLREETTLGRRLFGKAFGRAYASVMTGRSTPPADGSGPASSEKIA